MNRRFYVKDKVEQEGAAFQGFEVAKKRTTMRPKIIILFGIVLILLAGLLFLGYEYLGLKQNQQNQEKKTVLPTATPMPSNTPTPVATTSATPSVTGKLTPTPSGKLSPTPAGTASKRANITVSVLNGSGTPGAAGKVATYLKGLGYTIGTTGNASTFDYTNITIEVKKGDTTTLPLLKADLGKQYTVDSTTQVLSSSSPDDAEVIVGK